MLRQHSPMNRGKGFARKVHERQPAPPARPLLVKPNYSPASDAGIPISKECAIQHSGYMDVVRGFACIRCGCAPRSQFCHADMDKGMGIKTDCRRGWPGCAACHYFVGTSGKLSKEARRLLEAAYGQQTREKVIAAGLWPKRLPHWSEP